MFHRLIMRQEQRSRLFGEMLRRFSFDTRRDLSMGDAMTLTQAISRCRGCSATERCQAWVNSTEGTEGAEEFCPNVEAFKKLNEPPRS